MGRSLKKGPYVDPKLYLKVEKQNDTSRKEPITTWARACTIVPEFVGPHVYGAQRQSSPESLCH